MRKTKVINKYNNLLKIYIALFSLLNLVYWCLEIYKNKLGGLYLLDQQNNKIYFEKITDLSKTTSKLVAVIICSNILLLIILTNKDRGGYLSGNRRGNHGCLKKYLNVNFICIILFSIISIILSITFKVPSGNLLQPIISIFWITFLALIYYIIVTAYRFLISKRSR